MTIEFRLGPGNTLSNDGKITKRNTKTSTDGTLQDFMPQVVFGNNCQPCENLGEIVFDYKGNCSPNRMDGRTPLHGEPCARRYYVFTCQQEAPFLPKCADIDFNLSKGDFAPCPNVYDSTSNVCVHPDFLSEIP